MKNEYNGGLTREQFLFYEIRIVAALISQGIPRNEILDRIKEDKTCWVLNASPTSMNVS